MSLAVIPCLLGKLPCSPAAFDTKHAHISKVMSCVYAQGVMTNDDKTYMLLFIRVGNWPVWLST